ncbi:hypothetical protein L7F22_060268 [Adiantum nelumboides]|nr:hypothetical protein [Adiantum nelumboides]
MTPYEQQMLVKEPEVLEQTAVYRNIKKQTIAQAMEAATSTQRPVQPRERKPPDKDKGKMKNTDSSRFIPSPFGQFITSGAAFTMADNNTNVFKMFVAEDKLDGDNYPMWTYMMQHVLVSKGIWNIVQGIDVCPGSVDEGTIEDVAGPSARIVVARVVLPTAEQAHWDVKDVQAHALIALSRSMVDMEPLNIRKQKGIMWSPGSTSASSASQQQQWGESSGSSNRGGSVLFIASHQDDLEDTAHFKSSNSKAPHRKLPLRKRNKALKERSLFRHAISCWPALLALIVVPLLILEVCNFSQHNPTLPRRLGTIDEVQIFPENLTKKKERNLDNLDMPMRMIAGVRQPCLKLLSADGISNLDLPRPSTSPLNFLYYKKTRPFLDSSENASANRGLLFIGNQSMEEREQSFQVTDSMEVHCGFSVDDNTFHIEKEDRDYLHGCKAVVTTCNFGGGDDLYQPINMTQASLSKVCYVAFWDKVTLQTQALKGREPDKDRKIGHWRIVLVENLPFTDQRLNGKIPKLEGARATTVATEDALQDALLGDVGGSVSVAPSFAGTSRKRARVSQAEDEGASASTASAGVMLLDTSLNSRAYLL